MKNGQAFRVTNNALSCRMNNGGKGYVYNCRTWKSNGAV